MSPLGVSADSIAASDKTIMVPVGSPVTITITGITYEGKGEKLWLWAGLVQQGVLIYETRTAKGVSLYPISMPSQSEPVTVSIEAELSLIPVKRYTGLADAIVLVLNKRNLARPAWRLRAIWLDKYLIY